MKEMFFNTSFSHSAIKSTLQFVLFRTGVLHLSSAAGRKIKHIRVFSVTLPGFLLFLDRQLNSSPGATCLNLG